MPAVHVDLSRQIPDRPLAVHDGPAATGTQQRISLAPGQRPETDLPVHEALEIHTPDAPSAAQVVAGNKKKIQINRENAFTFVLYLLMLHQHNLKQSLL